MNTLIRAIAAVCVAAATVRAGQISPERQVQFRSVDFIESVIEVHNFGETAIALDGWRFCTHNNEQSLRYSLQAALNGMAIGPGDSLYVHMNSDAPPGPDHLNLADLGQFAIPFHRGPYALGLYWPNGGTLLFPDPDDMVDHVQWSVDGRDNARADERSQIAVNAGLWTAEDEWMVTSDRTLGWTLIPEGTMLHGPDDFDVHEPPGCNTADYAEPFGVLDSADINAFVTLFVANDQAADIDGDALFSLADIVAFLTTYTGGCP
ncbi:MAG: hypothetical protein K8E66_13575 [Phycisphaerales bacterium]|nr:hypothetical protein [Phycisphaerales bacterium]